MDQKGEEMRWYAYKVFFNKVFEADTRIREGGVETYFPVIKEDRLVGDRVVKVHKPAISSLLFVHCTEEVALFWQRQLMGKVMLYSHVTDNMRRPSPIDEEEMRVFILVTSVDDERLQYLDVGAVDYRQGQKVRVIDGPYKGCSGFIKRVKGNRRLLVSVEGLALVATSYIPSAFLERI